MNRQGSRGLEPTAGEMRGWTHVVSALLRVAAAAVATLIALNVIVNPGVAASAAIASGVLVSAPEFRSIGKLLSNRRRKKDYWIVSTTLAGDQLSRKSCDRAIIPHRLGRAWDRLSQAQWTFMLLNISRDPFSAPCWAAHLHQKHLDVESRRIGRS